MRNPRPKILLVEDNPGDVRLIQEMWNEGGNWCDFFTAKDGEEGLAFLRRSGRYADAPRPVLIILDINMPKKSGLELLAEIKTDEHLKRIPVVVLTSSRAQHDLDRSYELHANCYIVKPADLDQFIQCQKAIQTFWFDHVLLPMN
jgi:two-component system, chemotaxis family, response regulator Rcp1